MDLTSSVFTQCEIAEGSVEVEFILVQSENAGNNTVDALRVKVFSESIVLEVDGIRYTVNRESLVVDDEPHKPAPKVEEDDDSTVVIVVVIVVLLIIIVIVVVAFFVVKNKQNKNNKVYICQSLLLRL